MTESGGVFDNDGIINLNEFTYTRSDGKVFDFVPKELKGGLNVTETSSVGAFKTTSVPNNATTITTTVVSSTGTASLDVTTTQTFRNTTSATTAPIATESGSVGSKIDTKVGGLPFFGAIGSLVFAGLGAFMVL